MSTFCKYYKEVKQVSYDSGQTWENLDVYRVGELYESDSPDCGGGTVQYKWVNVSGEYTCVGTTKYQKTKKQQSTDGGQTWTDVSPIEYGTSTVIEYNSSDCIASNVKFSATYRNGNQYEKECNDSSLRRADVRPSGYDCTTMTSAVIGDCVTTVRDFVFSGCTALTSVTIGGGVTTIEADAFHNCKSLTGVTIPNNVLTLHSQVFYGTTFKSINIPSSISEIGVINMGSIYTALFSNNYNIENITVDNNNTVYDSRNNCNAIIKTSTNELIVGCKNTVIPNTVTRIGSGAFEFSSIPSNLLIPSGVTSIGDDALSTSALTSCTFAQNSSLTIIGYAAFAQSNLTTIVIPSGVTNIGERAFWGCRRLTSVTVEATTPPTLGEAAFYSTNNCPILVPAQSVNAYKSASGWSVYSSRIQAIS